MTPFPSRRTKAPAAGQALRRAAAGLCLAAALASAGCGRGNAEPKERGAVPAAASAAIPVRVAAAARVAMPRRAEFVGSLAGVEQVTVSSELEGTIERVDVDLGDPIRKGQALLSLVPDAFRFRMEQARAEVEQTAAGLGISPDHDTVDIDETSLVRRAVAEYDNAKADLTRRQGLVARNLIPRKEEDDALARFLVAEANVRAAREEANTLLATLRGRRARLALAEKTVRDARVAAPIGGFVEARLVSAGEYVKVGTPLFRLVNDRPIRLLGEIPESYAASLSPGLPVELTVDGQPGKIYRGVLKRISPSANVANRSIQVEAVFPNPSRELKSGVFGKGAVVLRVDQDAVAVPKQALITFAGINKVFVVSGGVAHERKVGLGEDLGGMVEVVEGVGAGEQVAVSNTGKLVEGASVMAEGGPDE